MPILTVEAIGRTTKGRAKITAGGHEYMVGDKCATPQVGMVIEADTSESSFQGNKGQVTLNWLNAWKLAQQNGASQTIVSSQQQQAPADHWKPPTTTPVNAAPSGPEPAKAAPMGYTEPERMFVSNLVAAAITAGHAKDPMDILPWASAALGALRNMTAYLPPRNKESF